MIVDPFLDKHLLAPFEGMRLLQETFQLVGAQILDPSDATRMWTLQAFYAPLEHRALGGVRAALTDQKGFVTFINQMDLEVLLGMEEPSTWCQWARQKYKAPGDRDWCGFAMDEDDLEDDLHQREMILRASSLTGILLGEEIHRRVHLDEKYDAEEYYILLWDADPDIGLTPDPRFETIDKRWRRVERQRCTWRYVR